MKTITGTLNFIFQQYSFADFLAETNRHNCEIIETKKMFGTYTVKVKGTDDNLEHARWFFSNCGSFL